MSRRLCADCHAMRWRPASEPTERPLRRSVVTRGRALATFLIVGIVGALAGVLVVSLPGLVGEGVTQCVDGTDGGYCRSYTIRNWPSGSSVGAAAFIGFVSVAVLATPVLVWRWLGGVLGP
jgi:hypothetical protein